MTLCGQKLKLTLKAVKFKFLKCKKNNKKQLKEKNENKGKKQKNTLICAIDQNQKITMDTLIDT